MTGRPALDLKELVLRGTFRSERHGNLLDSQTLPASAPPRLAQLQRLYSEAGSVRERRAIRAEFAEECRSLHAAGGAGLTVQQRLRAGAGFGLWAEVDDETGEVAGGQFAEWQAWDQTYGLRWRLRVGIPHDDDVAALARRAGVDGDAHELRAQLPQLVAAVFASGYGPLQPPPGWSALGA